MVYFDNAATTFPKPESVIRAMTLAQRNAANPGRGGHKMSQKAGQTVFETRQKIGEMFHTSEENVVFTKNCTESLNTAIKGLVNIGDHIIISSLEHNSVLRPVEKLKNENIITYDVFEVVPNDTEKTIKNFKSLIRNNTRLVICTHVSNVFGTVLPVEEIAKEAKKASAYFVLDAAQSAGTFEIDMQKGMFDIVCAPGHKGLLGPLGTGILLLRDNIKLSSFIEGGTGSFSVMKNQPEAMPDKFESGTLNYPGIAGLSKGIDFINSQGGIKAFYEHETALTNYFLENVKSIKGIKVYDDMCTNNKATVISLCVNGENSEKTAQKLDFYNIAVRGGYHCSYLAHKNYNTKNTGTVRISPGYFNTKKQVNFLCFCLEKIAKQDILC